MKSKKNEDELSKEIKDFAKKVSDIWNSTLESFFKKPLSLDEIASAYSKGTDEHIKKLEEKEKIKFIAGKFFIIKSEKEEALTRADLYFQNAEGGWIKKELNGKVPRENMMEDAIEKIKSAGIIEYEITSPEKR